MIELDIDGVAKGGEGVGRDEQGRVVFVRGALPGERVVVALEHEKRRHARGVAIDIVDAHRERVAAPCPQLAAGCGGCDLQHAGGALQRALKERIVGEAFERIGRLPDAPIRFGGSVPELGYRTTVRCALHLGRPAFRKRDSHELVLAAPCSTAHPMVDHILATSTFPHATEVQVRVGARTGEQLVSVWGDPSGSSVPDEVLVASIQDEAWIHEDAAGVRWRVSGPSFFQASPEGAELLVETVRSALTGELGADTVLADLYSGVGLFAGSLAASGRVLAVEAASAAATDAACNLPPEVETIRSAVEHWTPQRCDVVVADPARRGLGPQAVGVIDATGASTVVLISCDAAAGARDVGDLVRLGFAIDSVTVLDLFPQTAHVEIVSVLRR